MKAKEEISGKSLVVLVVGVAIISICAAVYARNVYDTNEQKLLATNKGNLGADAGFLSKYVQAYQIDAAHANTNFFRWQSGNGSVWVVRVTTSGTVTTWEKATGIWTNRTTLTYEPIND
jgi:hypothetical protein